MMALYSNPRFLSTVREWWNRWPRRSDFPPRSAGPSRVPSMKRSPTSCGIPTKIGQTGPTLSTSGGLLDGAASPSNKRSRFFSAAVAPQSIPTDRAAGLSRNCGTAGSDCTRDPDLPEADRFWNIQ
jgi:hypothetical protein